MYFGGYKIKHEIIKNVLSATTAFTLLLSTCIPSLFVPYVAAAEETTDEAPVIEEVVEDPAPEEVPVETQEDTETAPEDETESGDATVETGDALAETDIISEANTNAVETTTEDTEENIEHTEDDVATSSPDIAPENDVATSTEDTLITNTPETTSASSTATTTPADVHMDLSSNAQIDTSATTTATTGENTATSTGETNIETGDALASANIINLANTNIIDSYGFMLLMNALGMNAGTLDLRNFIAPLKQTGGACDDVCGSGGDTTINTTSTSTIDNTVIVRSQTGNNTGTGENTSIDTGDAYAGANVVNVANTNIIDSNYLLLTLNNFGDWSEDLVFPGKDFFANMLYGMGSSGTGDVSVNNTATVSNTVNTEADTGHNTASSTGDTSINTGDAYASTNVVNQVNTNFFNTDSVYILLKVHGNWSGNIFGLPPGLSWREGPQGIEIFGADNPQMGAGGSDTSLSVSNSAHITNNVGVYALTGGNQASGNSTGITTGDAVAGTNIVNQANTNILGRNWILAIVNIFGDWSGNLAFGRPDLWLGGSIALHNPMKPVTPGSSMTYKFTVVNRGDADATHVVLRHSVDIPFVQFDELSGVRKLDGHGKVLEWDLGTIPSGEHVEVHLPAEIKENIVSGTTMILSNTEVTSFETDADKGDNSESLSLMVENYDTNFSPISRVKKGEETGAYDEPIFGISKSAGVNETVASSTVDYTIVLHNEGSLSPDTVVIDTLTNEAGDVMSEQVWELGEVYEQEEITISYSSVFGEDTKAGLYTNTAKVLSRLGTDEVLEVSTTHELLVTEREPDVEPIIKPVEAVVPTEPISVPVISETEESLGYGMTLLPPMCSAYGCDDPKEFVVAQNDADDTPQLASAFGAGVDFGGDRNVKLFLLAAIMFAVSRKKEDENTPSMSSIF